MDCPKLTVRDYVVSSTYRKHEQKGANWGAWRTMGFVGDRPSKPVIRPTYGLDTMYTARSNHCRERRTQRDARVNALALAAPAATAGWADLLAARPIPNPAGGPEKLAAILSLAGLPLRWEPLNSSPQHRGIPSPSSLFPTALYVVGRHRGAASSFALLAQQGLLAATSTGAHVEAFLGSSDLALAVVGRLGDAVTPYGEFAPCLVALEGGHLQAQVAMAAAAVGWQCETEAAYDFDALRAVLGMPEWSDLPLTVVRINGAGAAEALAAELKSQVIAEYLPLSDDVLAYPRVKGLIEAMTPDRELGHRLAEARWPAHAAAIEGAEETSLAMIVARRGSGNGDGLAPLSTRLDAETLSRFTREAIALFGDQPSDLQAADLRISLSVLHGLGALDGGHDVDPRTGEISPWASDDPRDHLRARVSQGARDRSLVITLSVDDTLEMSRWGPRYFLLAHLAAGSLGQCFCIAAAAHNMSARPIRAYTDFIVDTALPLQRRAIYQIVCCFERRANPSFQLL